MTFRSIYSSDHFREREPYIALEINGVMMHRNILKQIPFLTITEEEGKKTLCQFTIKDPENIHSEVPIFSLQQSLVVYAGYRNEYEARGPFEIIDTRIKFVHEGIDVAVKGVEGGSLGRRAARRVIEKGTVRDLIKRIAEDNNLGLIIEDADGIDLYIDQENPIVQTGETDDKFLHGIAADFGWMVTITNGKMVISKSAIRKSLGVVELLYDRADTNMMKMEVSWKKPSVAHIPLSEIRGQRLGVQEKIALKRQVDLQGKADIASTKRKKEDNDAKIAREKLIKSSTSLLEDTPLIKAYIDSHPVSERTRLTELAPENADGDNTVHQEFAVNEDWEVREDHNSSRRISVSQLLDYQEELKKKIAIADRKVEDAIALNAGLENVSLDTVGEVIRKRKVAILDRNDKERSVAKEFDASARRLNPQSKKEDPIKVATRKVLSDGKVENITFYLKFGNVMFRVNRELILTGGGKRVDGKYRIVKVVHKFAGSGNPFATTLTCCRGWLSDRKKKKEKKKDIEGEAARSEKPTDVVDTGDIIPDEREKQVVFLDWLGGTVRYSPGEGNPVYRTDRFGKTEVYEGTPLEEYVAPAKLHVAPIVAGIDDKYGFARPVYGK